MWQIPYGFQVASCSFIGQEIGAGNLQKAQILLKFLMKIGFSLNILIQAILLTFSDYLVLPFTRNAGIIRVASKSIKLVIILHGLDFMQTVLYGALKALAL